MTKLLMQWGLGPELEEFGGVSQGNEYHEGMSIHYPPAVVNAMLNLNILSGATGELVGELPYHTTIMQQFLGEYMFLWVSPIVF